MTASIVDRLCGEYVAKRLPSFLRRGGAPARKKGKAAKWMRARLEANELGRGAARLIREGKWLGVADLSYQRPGRAAKWRARKVVSGGAGRRVRAEDSWDNVMNRRELTAGGYKHRRTARAMRAQRRYGVDLPVDSRGRAVRKAVDGLIGDVVEKLSPRLLNRAATRARAKSRAAGRSADAAGRRATAGLSPTNVATDGPWLRRARAAMSRGRLRDAQADLFMSGAMRRPLNPRGLYLRDLRRERGTLRSLSKALPGAWRGLANVKGLRALARRRNLSDVDDYKFRRVFAHFKGRAARSAGRRTTMGNQHVGGGMVFGGQKRAAMVRARGGRSSGFTLHDRINQRASIFNDTQGYRLVPPRLGRRHLARLDRKAMAER